jgi:hypothetical protein
MAKSLIREVRSPFPRLSPVTKQGFFVALFICAINWLVFALFIGKMPPQIPLWYSLPYGPSLLSSKESLLLLPGLATAFTLLNMLVTGWWRQMHESFSMIMAWTSVLVDSLLLIATIHIIILIL